MRAIIRSLRLASGVLLLAALASGAARAADPLRVVATTPDLAALAERVGGEAVRVESLTRGPQDPHFIEPRPSFIRTLHDADLLVQVGMDLEIGWLPALLRSARNARIQPGGAGHVNASEAITPLEVPTGPVDRAMGDVHVYGNPHYLTDPLNGLRVARLLAERLAELRPEHADAFQERVDAFERETLSRLVGDALAGRHPTETLLRVVESGELAAFLEERGEGAVLGGWLGAMQPHRPLRAVEDHQLWAYFARRFGIQLVATLEPKPGIAPTTRHLAEVVERVREGDVPLVLASPYFDPRHARWVAERTGARVVPMAHQVGAREGADGYLEVVDHNVRSVLEAL